MKLKSIFVLFILLHFPLYTFAESIAIQKFIEVNSQEAPPPKMPIETRKPTLTTEELLQQDQLIRQINIKRVDRIYSKLKNSSPIPEKANVIIYLNEQGNIKDILMSGQFSEDFADAIRSAINKVTPFDMPKDPELNKRLQEIRINFRTE